MSNLDRIECSGLIGKKITFSSFDIFIQKIIYIYIYDNYGLNIGFKL